MTADYADLCSDHWHCCPTLAAHTCDRPNRLQPCPTCGEAPAADPVEAMRLAIMNAIAAYDIHHAEGHTACSCWEGSVMDLARSVGVDPHGSTVE